MLLKNVNVALHQHEHLNGKKNNLTNFIVMKTNHCTLLFISVFLYCTCLFAQENTEPCKVLLSALEGKYTGECKKGLADGNGDARGLHHYTGAFKKGLPNGKGIYYYSDSLYHSGKFQDGIKEGKGETHYVRGGFPDSIIKGYWSGDVYRGNQYKTYDFNCSQNSDLIVEITPSEQNGNTITIDISTTTGPPGGGPTSLVINELISTDGNFIKKISGHATNFSSSVTYQLSKFPAKLFAVLSDGRNFQLELYKPATWTVRLKINK